ncbi:MAG: hypothetical protein HQM13_14115 [SAR324 cluster bacterium]|nr:hypothetical protein [SAR324 cluster bacterium]
MKTIIFLSLLFFTGLSCSSQQEKFSGNIHHYTPAQKEVLKRWQDARRVQQFQSLSENEIRAFLNNQMNSRFRQVLVLSEKSDGKICRADQECSYGFQCVEGLCVGGPFPEKYGKCIRGPYSRMVCSNSGNPCRDHQACIIR